MEELSDLIKQNYDDFMLFLNKLSENNMKISNSGMTLFTETASCMLLFTYQYALEIGL